MDFFVSFAYNCCDDFVYNKDVMNTIGGYNYILIEDPTSRGLILRVNALLTAGWFSVGGISYDGRNYLQAMGISYENAKTADNRTD